MRQYENIGKAILASYDKQAVLEYLKRKNENVEKIASKGWHVSTYFEEDDLMLAIYDERKDSETYALIHLQDFYINTDELIELHEVYKQVAKANTEVSVYRIASDKLARIIAMLPTFQAYYYQHNLRKTNNNLGSGPKVSKIEKAA